MKLTSTAFEHEGTIPSKYTCDGKNSSSPLAISGIPENAKTLALIMDDPDIPEEVKQKMGIQVFDHWVAFNIPPDTTDIPEGTEPGTQGNNSAGKPGYTGPCPPPQYTPREHRYFFKLYALATTLDLAAGCSKQDVETAMRGHVLAEATLMGRYQRSQ